MGYVGYLCEYIGIMTGYMELYWSFCEGFLGAL